MENAKVKEVKKELFIWSAKNDKGVKINGEVESTSINSVKSALRKKGLNIIYVKKAPKPLIPPRIKEADLVVFIRQLSTMVNSGVPIIQSFELLRSATSNKALKDLTGGIIRYLNQGESVSQAFSHYPKYFDRLFISLLEAGEKGGILDSILMRLADYREKSLALTKKIKSAMFYPAMTIAVMIVVVIILMIFVIPVFANLFKSFGATLPYLTTVVIDISNWMSSHWYIVVVAPIAAVWLFIRTYKRSKKFKWIVDKYSLKIPVLGDVILKGSVARFSRTFSTMQGAGVPIVSALESLSKVSGNSIIENVINKAKEDVEGGGRVSTQLIESGVFPIMAAQMIAIGEETGSIETMTAKVADFYENEVNELVARLSALMEPMIMVVLGIIVGTLVIAMYMPIFKMGAVVTHGG